MTSLDLVASTVLLNKILSMVNLHIIVCTHLISAFSDGSRINEIPDLNLTSVLLIEVISYSCRFVQVKRMSYDL